MSAVFCFCSAKAQTLSGPARRGETEPVARSRHHHRRELREADAGPPSQREQARGARDEARVLGAEPGLGAHVVAPRETYAREAGLEPLLDRVTFARADDGLGDLVLAHERDDGLHGVACEGPLLDDGGVADLERLAVAAGDAAGRLGDDATEVPGPAARALVVEEVADVR